MTQSYLQGVIHVRYTRTSASYESIVRISPPLKLPILLLHSHNVAVFLVISYNQRKYQLDYYGENTLL